MQTNIPKIVMDDVTVRFAGHGPAGDLLAVEHINLSVADGEFVCIVGPSGCGKTTLLRVLAGLQAQSSGTFQINRTDPARPVTAMVFQGASVFPWMTVLENVAYGLRTRGVAYAERTETAMDWIRRMKLEKFAEAYPHQLSGGMQQRVGLARAFAFNPEILLMDEPFGALDAQTRLVLQETLLDLWATTHNTILFVTHAIDEALTLADRVLVMSARPGHILAEDVVTIPRPRDTLALRSDPHFGDLFARIWSLLKDEVAAGGEKP